MTEECRRICWNSDEEVGVVIPEIQKITCYNPQHIIQWAERRQIMGTYLYIICPPSPSSRTTLSLQPSSVMAGGYT